MTILNLFVLTFFAAVGATSITPSNWVAVNGSYVPYGAASLFSGAGTIFFAYLGFDMVSSLAEETKNPQKNLPRGIIGSLVVAASVYFSVSFVATGMVNFIELTPNRTDSPLSTAFDKVGLDWAAKVVSFGSLFGLTTATFSGLLGQPRIFYIMARDVSHSIALLMYLCISFTHLHTHTLSLSLSLSLSFSLSFSPSVCVCVCVCVCVWVCVWVCVCIEHPANGYSITHTR